MPLSEFTDTLSSTLIGLGVPFEAGQVEKLARHFELLIEANARFNLTRITEPRQAAIRLYADSAAVLLWAHRDRPRITNVLDVGSGAGFPAVPLAVLAPLWQVTALESTGKKADFITQAATVLQLENLRAVHAHSDHWPHQAAFDLLTFKAVSRLAACLNTASRFTVAGGHVVAFKTAALSREETDQARLAAQRSGFVARTPLRYELPHPHGLIRLALHVYAHGKPPRETVP